MTSLYLDSTNITVTMQQSNYTVITKPTSHLSIFHVQPKFWHKTCELTHWMPLCAVPPPVVFFGSTICVISILSLAPSLAITGNMSKPSAAFILDAALFTSIQWPKSRCKQLQAPGICTVDSGKVLYILTDDQWLLYCVLLGGASTVFVVSRCVLTD